MDWFQLAVNGGVGLVVVVGAGAFIWRLSGWTGRELVIPLRDQLFRRVDRFFDHLESTMPLMQGAIERNTEATRDLCDAINDRLNCTRQDCDFRSPPARGGQRKTGG